MYTAFETVDWVEDAQRENSIRLYRLQRFKGDGWGLRFERMFSAAQSWIVHAVAGAVVGILAVFIDVVTGLLADLREGHCAAGFYLNKDICCFAAAEETCSDWVEWSSFGPLDYLFYILFSVIFATIACFLVLNVGPYAAGSGISEIKCIVGGFILKGFLGLNTLVIKSIALPLTIASGLSVGKEGPSVHYAACVGNVVGRLFIKYRQHNSKRTELLTACTAAGVAVAFGSPIGGVLFSLEEISSNWELTTFLRSYFCCLVATSVLTVLNPFRNGKMVLFSVLYEHDWHWFELPVFAILGVFGGVVGHLIIKYNLRIQAWRKQYLKSYALQEVVVLTTITACVCYFNEFLKVDMTKSMSILFHECDHGWEHESCNPSNNFSTSVSLIFAMVIRLALVLVSYGAKVPAGIFVPSLAIGALFGRLVGTAVWSLQLNNKSALLFASCPAEGVCVDPGTYAFLGAAALLSGVMHLSITVVVVMFELTGALKFIIPLMIVVGITTLLARFLDHGGIADQAIIANGYPFFMEEFQFEGLVEDVMVKPEALEVYGPLPRTLEHRSYPVIDHEGFLVGSVEASELELEESGRFDPAKCTTNPSPVTVPPGSSLEWIAEIFTKLGPRAVYVVEQGTLVGVLTRKDMLRFYQNNKPVVKQGDFERRLGQLFEQFSWRSAYDQLRGTDQDNRSVTTRATVDDGFDVDDDDSVHTARTTENDELPR